MSKEEHKLNDKDVLNWNAKNINKAGDLEVPKNTKIVLTLSENLNVNAVILGDNCEVQVMGRHKICFSMGMVTGKNSVFEPADALEWV